MDEQKFLGGGTSASLLVVDESALRRLLREEFRTLREEQAAQPRPAPSGPFAGTELLTVPQASEFCQHHVATIRTWIKAGRLKASKPARHYLVRRADLEAFLADGGNAKPSDVAPEDEAARILKQLRRK